MVELLEISKHDQQYREYAYRLTGCKQQGDDLVNDMYIRLHGFYKKHPQRSFKIGLAYVSMKNMYLDNKRQQAKGVNQYIEEINIIEQSDCRLTTELRILVSDIVSNSFDKLHHIWLLEESFSKPLRQIEEETGIKYSTVHKRKWQYLKKLQTPENLNKLKRKLP